MVDGRRIVLKFPFSGIEFDLPGIPQEQETDIDFVIRSTRGTNMTMTISYLPDLKAFTGIGRENDDKTPVITFFFFPPNSPLTHLPKLWLL